MVVLMLVRVGGSCLESLLVWARWPITEQTDNISKACRFTCKQNSGHEVIKVCFYLYGNYTTTVILFLFIYLYRYGSGPRAYATVF